LQSDLNRVPSVACLLYLAADQIVMRGMSGTMLKATKVPLPARLGAADRAGGKDRGSDLFSLRGSRRAATRGCKGREAAR
jgi:hypothetical protein